MKILFLTDNFPPEVNAPASRTYEHCAEWVKKGAEVTVITCAPNFPMGKVFPGYRNKLIQKEMVSGIKVIRVWTYMSPNKGLMRRTLDFISFMVSAFIAGLTVRTDLIVATSPQFFTAIAGWLLSIIKFKPWVMEVRDLWPDSILEVEAVKSTRMLGVFFRIEVAMYKHARLIIAVTDSFKKRIIGKGIREEKIKVVKNGANLSLFSPRTPDQDLKRSFCGENRWLMSYIGTHGMAHGLDFILDCAPDLDEMGITLLFVGDGAKKGELEARIRQEKLKNIVMLPPSPKEEVPALLAISDFALIPLRKADLFETVIPSKIFEASAMKIPILLGVRGESRRLVEHYQAGIAYEPENKAELFSAVTSLMNDKELYERCRNGGEKLAADFNRKQLAGELLELLEMAANKRVST